MIRVKALQVRKLANSDLGPRPFPFSSEVKCDGGKGNTPRNRLNCVPSSGSGAASAVGRVGFPLYRTRQGWTCHGTNGKELQLLRSV